MKPKIGLIALFNIDFGIRHISSYLNYKGFPTSVICFGQLKMKYEIVGNNYISSKPMNQKACKEENLRAFIELIKEKKFDIIGISLPSTMLNTAKLLTKKIKEIYDIPIVWGGIHPTLSPEDCIQYTDYVCVGEGEDALYEFATKFEKGEELTNIPNFWIKRKDGFIEKNEIGKLIDVEAYPYPDFITTGNKYLIAEGEVIENPNIVSAYQNNSYPIMSSRGCHFACSYCCNSVFKVTYKGKGSYVRRRSVKHTIDELLDAIKTKELVDSKFWDDIFSFDEEWIAEFKEEYKNKIALPYSCYVHPKYTNRKIIDMLFDAGLKWVEVGIQSGSESFCKEKLNRNQSNDDIISFGYLLKELGATPRYNVIADNPFESDEDMNSTAELLLHVPYPYTIAIYSLCFFPKTKFTQDTLDAGRIKPEEVEGVHDKALNNFYMFPDFAKSKQHIFWDVIFGMIVSGYFSDKLVRWCKSNRFFRNHPKLFLSLIRSYLKLGSFKIIDKIFFNQKSEVHPDEQFFWRNPKGILRVFKFYIKLYTFFRIKNIKLLSATLAVDLIERFINDYEKPIYTNITDIELFTYPDEKAGYKAKKTIMKIVKTKKDTSYKPLDVIVCIRPLRSEAMTDILGVWEMQIPITENESIVETQFAFPEFNYTFNGETKKAKTIYTLEDERIKKETLLLYFLYKYNHKYVVKSCTLIYAK